jgi:hypothetical protein
LTRIESSAFSYSSLQSIVIPRNVQFINGSALDNVKLSSVTIENGNTTFVVENDLLIDILFHKLIRNFSRSSKVDIPNHIEIFGLSCFSYCKSLSSISFESNSRLTRIEASAFSESSLQSIIIPSNVEILCSRCFSYCKSFSYISFESNSRLTRIESHPFYGLSCTIVIPSTVLFVASDLGVRPSQLVFAEGDSFQEFHDWLGLNKSGIVVDFRRILRFDSDLSELKNHLLKDSVIEEIGMIVESAGIYQRF